MHQYQMPALQQKVQDEMRGVSDRNVKSQHIIISIDKSISELNALGDAYLLALLLSKFLIISTAIDEGTLLI